ncbi:MAG TPA: hypothetical protein VNA67_04600 [Pseudonocardiaceae bacterium]|nr:hypothetical protein [Pseudonocardiaceae bacterium]
MSSTSPTPPPVRQGQQRDSGQLADAIAAAVRAHPAVADLDGGPFGAIAYYLPGRRVVGVRVGEPGEPVEVSVVARLGTPLPQLATELRRLITAVTGSRVIDLTINDVITGDPIPAPPPASTRSRTEGCPR